MSSQFPVLCIYHSVPIPSINIHRIPMAIEIVDLPMNFMVFFSPEPTGEVQASPRTRATNVLRWRRDLDDATATLASGLASGYRR